MQSNHTMSDLINLIALVLLLLWNLVVGVGIVASMNHDLWLGSVVTILLREDVLNLLVEGWAAEFDGAVEFDIDGHAHEGGSDGLVEESNKEIGNNQSIDNDENHWHPDG